MTMKAFFENFLATYKATYEIEKKLLIEKQDEQIDSLKVSVSMGQNIDEKKLLEIVKRYVSAVNQVNNMKTYTYITSNNPIDHLIYGFKKVH
ncbi:hypothetical protein [Acinetobacter rongchengensis]|uniref:Uncharacterized protein n=1 Tax=Acinetobacter rongchengensis TaxID=2419601 RepID=A0A3A8FHZ5_9GAMM|nr:hypothetical protein [Acinetobacter rongchengensis]RKG40363.1 hypothetical protein D7V20_01610 [Acinetobacter rongchengensis]